MRVWPELVRISKARDIRPPGIFICEVSLAVGASRQGVLSQFVCEHCVDLRGSLIHTVVTAPTWGEGGGGGGGGRFIQG